jgi:hypothetical protein
MFAVELSFRGTLRGLAVVTVLLTGLVAMPPGSVSQAADSRDASVPAAVSASDIIVGQPQIGERIE